MAVYTDIRDDELRCFLERYSIGDLLSCRGIVEGVENSNYLLHTTTGHYILTLYEKRVAAEDLPFFLGLMQHLADKSLACPQPVMPREGLMVNQLAGRPAAIFTFLEGMWPRLPMVSHCREVGRGMAAMHLAAQDFPLKRENSLSLMKWRPLWNQSRSKASGLRANIEQEIDAELSYLEKHWPDDLPIGTIHADLFNDNVFFLNQKLSGIIDFYFACTDILAYDIAIALNAWCFERDFSYNLTKGQGLLKSYQALRCLNEQEIEQLPLLARGAALRFFLTRLYDWLNTSSDSFVVKKDPMEYWRKLTFFRAIRHASELGF